MFFPLFFLFFFFIIVFSEICTCFDVYPVTQQKTTILLTLRGGAGTEFCGHTVCPTGLSFLFEGKDKTVENSTEQQTKKK